MLLEQLHTASDEDPRGRIEVGTVSGVAWMAVGVGMIAGMGVAGLPVGEGVGGTTCVAVAVGVGDSRKNAVMVGVWVGRGIGAGEIGAACGTVGAGKIRRKQIPSKAQGIIVANIPAQLTRSFPSAPEPQTARKLSITPPL